MTTVTASLPVLEIQVQQLKKATLFFRAINHPLRQHMLQMMHQQESTTVTELYVKLRLEQSVVSQHLAILRKVHLVKTQRKGKHICYSVNYDRLQQLQQIAAQLLT